MWHVDGYDKLKPYGFAIHGCIAYIHSNNSIPARNTIICSYSRKIIWLTSTNRKLHCYTTSRLFLHVKVCVIVTTGLYIVHDVKLYMCCRLPDVNAL